MTLRCMPVVALHLARSLRRRRRGAQGNINLVEAAARSGVKRFVLVTSIGTGDSRDAPPAQARPRVRRRARFVLTVPVCSVAAERAPGGAAPC